MEGLALVVEEEVMVLLLVKLVLLTLLEGVAGLLQFCCFY